jgi:hypothetical protein
VEAKGDKLVATAVSQPQPKAEATKPPKKGTIAAKEARKQAKKGKEGAEPSGGIAWQTAIRNTLANDVQPRRRVMQRRHRRLKSKFGQAIGTRKHLLAKGMEPAEAQRRSMGKLAGKEDLEGQYRPITEILEPEQVRAIDAYITDINNMSYGDSLAHGTE